MKVLIAYDGTKCAEDALDDLRLAGLPRQVEVLVLSIADVFLPPAETQVDPDIPRRYLHQIRRAHLAARQAVEASYGLASKACGRLKASYPDWSILAEACADEPAWGVIKKADAWKPDLIVVGTHNPSFLRRLIAGSVSEKVLLKTRSSVRIARTPVKRGSLSTQVVVGINGSPEAETVVRVVAERLWPFNTVIHLIAVTSPSLWDREGQKDWKEGAQSMIEAQAEKLRRGGLAAFPLVIEGDPRQILLEEAQRKEAECIFIGSGAFIKKAKQTRLSPVAKFIARQAPCSVEIVRSILGERV